MSKLSAQTRILKNVSTLSLSILIERAAGFLLALFVARTLGREAWGDYNTALSFALIGVSIGYWGFMQFLPRQIAKNPLEAGQYLSSALWICFLSGGIVTAMSVGIVFVLDYEPSLYNLILLAIVLTTIPNIESIVFEAIIFGLEKMEWVALVRLPATLLRTGFAVWLLLQGYGIEILFIAMGIYYVVISLGYLIILRRQFTVPLIPTWEFSLQLWRLAIPFAMLAIISEPFKLIDKIFLSKLWDTEWVGIYSTGILFVQLLQMVLPPAIMNSLLPGLTRSYQQSEKQFSSLSTWFFKLLLVGTFPIVLAINALASWVIPFVFGREYDSSIIVLQIASWSLLFLLPTRLLFHVLLASDNELLAIPTTTARSIMVVLMSLALIPPYGVVGAGIVLVVVEITGLLFNMFFISRRVFVFPCGSALITPLCCIALSSATYFASITLLPEIVSGIISLFIYFAVLWLTRTISSKDYSILNSYAQKS